MNNKQKRCSAIFVTLHLFYILFELYLLWLKMDLGVALTDAAGVRTVPQVFSTATTL